MKLHNIKQKAAKLFVVLLLGCLPAFADTVIETDDFYKPWIVGSWECFFSVNTNEYSESTYAHIDISGCEVNSEVCLIDETGEDYLTLEELVQDHFSIFAVSQSELEALPEEDVDLNIEGDTKFRLNDEENMLYMNFSISFEGETMSLNFKMTKNTPENNDSEEI